MIRLRCLRCWSVICLLVGASAALPGQEAVRPAYKVTIKDGRAVVGEPVLPLDMTQRIRPAFSGPNHFGLTVENNRITFSQNGSIWSALKVDGQISNPFAGFNGAMKPPAPLPPTASGQKRLGTQSTWDFAGIHVTQIIETVPSKPSTKAALAAQKRLLDTCRMTLVLDNTTAQTRKVAFKTSIDILIVNNDGALYASPTTAPGKILNGVALQGKEMPAYLWVLQNPDLNNPGFVATMTLKHSKGENPSKIVLANLGVVSNFQQWDVQPQPAGDSACALFWDEKAMKPHEKRSLVWGYGGGISPGAGNDGHVTIDLSGSFEPNKLFTIAAHVEDAAPEQALALELPDGMERVQGRVIQSVAAPANSPGGVVLWKARVLRPGSYEIRVRSSTGMVQSKHVSIKAVDAR